MATSSNERTGRNRQPDYRYQLNKNRYRLHDPDYTMAFATKTVQSGYKYTMTPSMLLV